MELQRQTFRIEIRRAGASGILETAASTFLLLIAVRQFHADPLSKGLIAAGGSLGLLLSPIIVYVVEKARITIAKGMSRLFLGAAVCFLLSIFAQHPLPFAVLTLSALGFLTGSIPLLTQLYHDNYQKKTRGQLVSRSILIRISAAILFSEIGGRLLSVDFSNYQLLLVIFALSGAYSSFMISQCPSQPLSPDEDAHMWRGFRFLSSDKIFRHTLISWMLLGIGNLMMWPLRVEYLANPIYGLSLSAANIALLTGVIPNIARFAMSSVWGNLFDRVDFFRLRVILNMTFALGILSFFISTQWTWLLIGAIFYGIGNAGGDVAWSLWVTKIAPPERVADYMAVHTFLTGFRGVLAPILAFQLLHFLTIDALGWICVGLIAIASLLLLFTREEKTEGIVA